MKIILSILICGMMVGCASKGFNRGVLRDQLGVKSPVVTDQEIDKAFNLKANLPSTFKLGVYFKPKTQSYWGHDWRWTEKDKDIFLNLYKEKKGFKNVSSVFQILPSTAEGKDLKSIRLAAARHGADAVLIVSGVGEVDKYINNLGWTYVLLAPVLFIPGSEADTLFMASASLWDVRNEFLYLTAEAEAQTNTTYVAAYGKENKVLLGTSKSKALAKLKDEVVNMVEGIERSH